MRSQIKTALRGCLPRGVYRVIRRRRVLAMARRYETRVVSHRYGGHELRVELCDPLAEGWYDHDWPLLPELVVLGRHGLRTGSRVFDLGAHHGVLALMCARIVGPEGEVVAVEAEPHNASAAARNVALNAASNVAVVHAAASADSGHVRFTEGLNGKIDVAGPRLGKVVVPMVTVDGLAHEHGLPDVVLIDVEGHEYEVLLGARETRRRAATTFFVEVHVGHGLSRTPQEVAELFDERFDLMIAPDSDDHSEHSFEPYAADSDVLRDRFFLVAARRDERSRTGADRCE